MTKEVFGKISGGHFSLKWLGWRVIFFGILLKKVIGKFRVESLKISGGDWKKFRVEKHFFGGECLKKSSEICRTGKCHF